MTMEVFQRTHPIQVVRSCSEMLRKLLRIIIGKKFDLDLGGKRGTSFVMFNFFFNWLDPKILRMEQWVNLQVIHPDKLDIDLDKVKKGEVRDTEMFNRTLPTAEGQKKMGPFITNLQGGELLSLVFGPGEVEAFGLFKHDDNLWWRHRDAGTTHDFRVAAFDDMQEFVAFIDSEFNFWECVLRSEARLSEMGQSTKFPLQLSEIKQYIRDFDE